MFMMNSSQAVAVVHPIELSLLYEKELIVWLFMTSDMVREIGYHRAFSVSLFNSINTILWQVAH